MADAFEASVKRAMADADRAERRDLATVLAAFTAAQRDLRDIVAAGTAYGVTVAAARERVQALEDDLVRMVADVVPAAAERGAVLIDQALAADDVQVPPPRDVTAAPAVDRQTETTREHTRNLATRVIATLALATGPNPAPLERLLDRIGTRPQGSLVFGAPTAHTLGSLAATVNDTSDDQVEARAADLAADPNGPQTMKRWVHSGSRESRSEHVSAAAATAGGIAWSAKFQIGAHRTDRPRGSGLPGAQRFGCRCRIAPVLITPQE